MRRFYAVSRGAWTPRIWPWLFVVGSAAGVTAYALMGAFGWVGLIASWPIAVAIAWSTINLRWAIWRRRHPQRRPGDIIQGYRDAAPFN